MIWTQCREPLFPSGETPESLGCASSVLSRKEGTAVQRLVQQASVLGCAEVLSGLQNFSAASFPILQVPLPARRCQLHRLKLSEDERAIYDVFLARSRCVPGKSTFSHVLFCFFLAWRSLGVL